MLAKIACSQFPSSTLGSVALSLSGGATPSRDDDTLYAESGIAFLRIQNISEQGLALDDVKFITPETHTGLLARTMLEAGDLLMTITGRIGTAAVVPATILPANINQHIVRIQLDSERVEPQFVADWLNSPAGTSLSNRGVTGTTRIALDYTAVREISLPLPPVDVQRQLVREMDAARQVRQRKLAEADGLLAGLDAYLLDQLGLTPPAEDNRKVFAVRLGQLRGKRMDAPAYQPFYATGHPPKTPTKPLESIADIGQNTAPKPTKDTELVPYIGLPECELTEVREVAMRPYSEVRGRSVVKQGDILFARIEPSVFNKKYVFSDDLKGHAYAYTSTEFYVVRAKPGEILQEYLYALFFCSFVFAQVKGKTTGSSGRRRIDSDLFSLLQIPVPDRDLQEAIATEVKSRRESARRLRAESLAEWMAAKQRFAQQLLSK